MKRSILFFLVLGLMVETNAQNKPNGVMGSTATDPESLVIPTISTSDNVNQIIEYSFKEPVILIPEIPSKEQAQIINYYFDGLGRPLQDVYSQISPTGMDWVKPYVYDAYDRPKYGLMAYPSDQNDGSLILSPEDSYESQLNSIYPSEGNYFQRISYEASPNQRVVKSAAPGNSWSGSDRGVTVTERLNTSADYVRKFKVPPGSFHGNYIAVYPDNELLVTRTVDEDGKISEVFTNNLGQMVLSRVAISSAPGTGFSAWLWTYYIYDQKSRLVNVMMPEAANICNSSGNWNLSQDAIAGHVFKYKYDSRDRLYEKKAPGSDVIEYVYDHLYRVVMERDPQEKEAGFWLVYKYDEFDQVHRVGRVPSTLDLATYQANVDSDQEYITDLELTSTDQTNIIGTYDIAGTLHEFNSSFNSYFSVELKDSKAIYKKLTGKRKKNDETGDYVTEVYFYDQKGNMIQKKAINPMEGTEWTTIEYDFLGNILTSYHVQENPNGVGVHNRITVLKNYHYDHAKRLTSITQQVNDQTLETLVTYEYDELGKLIRKNWDDIQSVDFEYNPRGWLTHINDADLSEGGDTFGMELYYDFGYDTTHFNGNIAGIQWKSSRDGVKKSYGYGYDPADRLSKAYYVTYETAWDQQADHYSISDMSYDRNGNIKTLTRMGETTGPDSYGIIDQLTYTYDFNRLIQVEDAIDPSIGLAGFKNGASASDEFQYDQAGSLTADANKGITNITYNLNGLTTGVSLSQSNTELRYNYDSEGIKLTQTLTKDGAAPVNRQYMGDFVYENDTLLFFMHEEGRTTLDSTHTFFQNEYFHKDHLGNVRQIISKENSNLVQENDYYPFGGVFNSFTSGTENLNKFNGKEEQKETGWYDFGQRMQDPWLGRFFTQDRFADKYFDFSPYQYAANNPISYIDINGDSLWINHKGNDILYENGNLKNSDGSAYKGKGVKVKKDGTVKAKGFLGKTVAALGQASSTAEGGAMVTELQSSNNNFTIQKASSNSFVASDGGKAHANQIQTDPSAAAQNAGMQAAGISLAGGSGGTINWNPSGTQLPTTGGVQSNGVTDLAHEMFHGLDANRGLLDTRTHNGIERSEWQATYRENTMRVQLGLSLRTHYKKQVDPSGKVLGGTGVRMITPANRPILPSWYTP